MTSTAVITFGRMNPITVGHEKLVNKVKDIAADLGAAPLVYLSHSQDSNKNPIPYIIKANYAQEAFGKCVQITSASNIISIAKQLDSKYDNLVFVGDAERAGEFLELLNSYNGKEYSFNTITTVSAGDRTDDSDFVDSMSATKMRNYAINNDIESFSMGVPERIRRHSKNLMNFVRKGLNYEN